tara:strand:+ start:3381 stop:3482 length:102 start_codon:yes stop_codon:yes gene_type:complete
MLLLADPVEKVGQKQPLVKVLFDPELAVISVNS